MGWSSDDRVGTRGQEAAARHGVMGRIGYRGRLDDDGHALEGPGAAVGRSGSGPGSNTPPSGTCRRSSTRRARPR